MSVDYAQLVRALGAKGMSPDEIADIIEAMTGPVPAYGMEATTLNARQLRNQRYYENKRRLKASEIKTIKTDQDVSDAIKTVSDAAEPSRAGAQVVIPSLPPLRSEEVGVGGVVARAPAPPTDDWPDGKAIDHAAVLVALVGSHWLDPNRSPDLVTTRSRLAAWKREGASWEHDVVPVVTGLCANRRSRISSWKFFDDAIARSIGDNRRALEIPEADRVVPIRGTGPPSSLTDRMAAERAEAHRLALEDLQKSHG